MRKEEAIGELKKRGHQATIENGVLMILMPTDEESEKGEFYDKIRSELREIGYDSSWGVAYTLSIPKEAVSC